MFIYFRRGWMVLGAVLLLMLALGMLLRERGKAGIAVNPVARDVAAASSAPVLTEAERARRAAIAALGPGKDRGVNAADLYKDALGLYADLTDEEKTMLRHWRDKGDPKTAAALYAKIQPIMDLLRSARKADYVDWGTGPPSFEDQSAFKSLMGVQNLARVAAWEAAFRFQSDPDGALGDVAAMEAMGRGEVDSLIGLLVEDGIHAVSINVIAQNAGGITSAAGPDLAYIASPAAAEQGFQSGLNGEASMLQAELDEYANPATRSGTYIQKWASSGSMSPEDVISEFEWSIQTEQGLEMTLTEPDAQFQQWWTQKLAEAASNPVPIINQLLSQSLQALASVRNGAQVSMAQSAMLEAGLALEQNGHAQFQTIVDPASGQPFVYTQTATGFQLGSVSQYHNKPLTLDFSTPAAAK